VSSINLGEHQGDGIRYSMHLSAPAGGAAQMLRDPAGNWVGYAEYAALQAEVERLRKAGDALARAAEQSAYHKEDYNVIKAWLAANETRP
jgi:hypothetical protein